MQDKHLGEELLRDKCPEKHCSQSTLVKDIIPSAIAMLLVELYSGFLVSQAVDSIITIAVYAVIYVLLIGYIYFMFKGMKKRLADTYIKVCENGICGVCPANGFKNREFIVKYEDISKVKANKERIQIFAKNERIALLVHDAKRLESIINQKIR